MGDRFTWKFEAERGSISNRLTSFSEIMTIRRGESDEFSREICILPRRGRSPAGSWLRE
jgi:hypothetical protein